MMVSLTSCSKDRMPESNHIIITAAAEQQAGSDTKTALTSTNTVVWSEGDSFGVLYAGSAAQEFTLASGTGTANGTFAGDLPSGYSGKTLMAVYPYSSSTSISGTTLTFSLPQTQVYTENSIGEKANPSIGVFDTDTRTVSFKNVCGVLRLAIKGSTSVQSISVADNKTTAKLWGTASASISSSTYSLSLSGGDNSVILSCGGVQLDPETATTFYIVVPVGSFSTGFTATVRTPEGNVTFSTSKDNSVKRSVIKEMPENTLGEPDPVQLEEYTVLNDLMQEYMDKASYTSLTRSQTSYFTSAGLWTKVSAQMSSHVDYPKGVTVDLGRTTQSSVRLILATDEAFQNVKRDTTLTNSETQFELISLIPGNTYWWKSVSSTTVLNSGAFKVVGQLRPIKIEGGWNGRDLGGWTGLGGHKIQYEKMYRGGSLNAITTKAKTELQQVGIKAELDFRGLYTSYNNYEGIWATSNTAHNHALGYCPIYGSQMWTRVMSDYEQNKPLTHSVQVSQLAYVIKCLKAGYPVYFHCKSGADRTGEFGFTCEAILGLSEGDMVKEYELTTFSYENCKRIISDASYFATFFEAIQGMTTSATDVTFTSLRDRCYYYLNRYFVDNSVHTGDSQIGLNASDIDWFIAEMLGITEAEAATYRPSWARDNYTWTLDELINAAHPSKCSSH